MSKIVRLVQGSPEWHEHRRLHRNASETPIVMGLSPWQTPYQLWQYKLGLATPEVTPAMLHGLQLEPAARAAYERRTGLTMQPLVLVEGDYSASLDGYTLAGDRLLEVKCPLNGRESTLWQSVAARQLPEHYWWQVQHQLLVTRADIADVFVFDGNEGLIFPVAPEPASWAKIHAAWDAFSQHVASKSPPPLIKGDVVERDDADWTQAATAYGEAKRQSDGATKLLDEAKAKLVALTRHTSESGGGVTVTRYWKSGTIDYKKIPELAAVDVDLFRGPPREEVRVTVR